MKKLIVALLVLSSIGAYSQDRSWDWGFNLGANRTMLDVPANSSSIYSAEEGLGFQCGILANRMIIPFIYFTPKAELSFNSAEINFKNSFQPIYDVMPVSLNLAPHLRIRLEIGKYAPYIVFGPSYKFPVNKRSKITDVFDTSPDLALDLGIGIELKRKFFTVAPELRYSYGTLNVNQSPQIMELYMNQLSLIFNFY